MVLLTFLHRIVLAGAVASAAVAASVMPAQSAQPLTIDAPLTGVPPALLTRSTARVRVDGRDVTSLTTFQPNRIVIGTNDSLGSGERVIELDTGKGSGAQRRFWYFITPAQTSTVAAEPFTASLGAIAPQPYPVAAPLAVPNAIRGPAIAPAPPAPVLYGCSLSPGLAVSQTCISNAPGSPAQQPGPGPLQFTPPLHPNPYVIGPVNPTPSIPGH